MERLLHLFSRDQKGEILHREYSIKFPNFSMKNTFFLANN